MNIKFGVSVSTGDVIQDIKVPVLTKKIGNMNIVRPVYQFESRLVRTEG